VKAIISLISLLLIVFTVPCLAVAQVDEARQALDRGENIRAVNILSAALADKPTADTYLYLGIAYERIKEYGRAEDTLKEGSKRFPADARFQNQLADLFLENNDREAARAALQDALEIDPNNNYASDLLATIDMSEGEVQSALRTWNKSGRPIINDILHNYYLQFGSWVVRDAVAFHPSGVLRYSQWKTTESRLLETDNFTNVGLEIEPTAIPDQYNAIVRTTTKSNSPADLMFGLLRGAPFQITYLDYWNIGNSGINFNGNWRWEAQRRRLAGQLKIPVRVQSLLSLQTGSWWRDEHWNLTPVILPQFRDRALVLYKATAMGAHFKQIPNYRVEYGGGFEYRNRAAAGDIPKLYTNNLNTGKFTAELNLRPIDRRYQNRIHLEGFAARRALIGNTNFTGGVAQLDNRVTVSKDTRSFFDWTIKGGTSRGLLPIEDYFALGLDTYSENPLRAHTLASHDHYGNGPMGTDFVLVNTDFERRLATIPFFNTVNIPYVTVKWQVFFDGAKTWDRNHIFQQGTLWLDTGGGIRLETPTHALNLIYGKSLRNGNNVLFAYYERRLW
jgi:tetratricopeptide (TPR) repeat protein